MTRTAKASNTQKRWFSSKQPGNEEMKVILKQHMKHNCNEKAIQSQREYATDFLCCTIKDSHMLGSRLAGQNIPSVERTRCHIDRQWHL